jgi:hypothetical protein
MFAQIAVRGPTLANVSTQPGRGQAYPRQYLVRVRATYLNIMRSRLCLVCSGATLGILQAVTPRLLW